MTAKQLPGRIAPDGSEYVTLTDGAGNLGGATITLNTSDLEIGAVEIKNSTTDDRVSVSAAGAMKVDGSAVTQPVSIATAPVLVAGSALIGKVGLDQTTPGTTNAVSVAQLGSTTVSTGNGVVGAGVQRVALASDSTGIVALPAAGTSVVGTKAAGTAAATSLLAGQVFNSTAPTLTDGQQAAAQADTAGSHFVNTEGKKATYSAGLNVSIAASATDVVVLSGSASKTVRVTRITLNGIATANTTAAIALVKRSTANTGGTVGSTPTPVPLDSSNGAVTAVLVDYTANPTTGTTVGTVRQERITFNTAATSSVNTDRIVWEFGTRNTQALVLRGTAQQACVNFGGNSVTGGVLTYTVEWTEE